MKKLKKMKILMIILSITILFGCVVGKIGKKGEDGKDGDDGKAYIMIEIPDNADDIDFNNLNFIEDAHGSTITPGVYYEADPGTYSGHYTLHEDNGDEHTVYYIFKISVDKGERGEEGTYGTFGEDEKDGDDGKDGEDRYYHLNCYSSSYNIYYDHDD